MALVEEQKVAILRTSKAREYFAKMFTDAMSKTATVGRCNY